MSKTSQNVTQQNPQITIVNQPPPESPPQEPKMLRQILTAVVILVVLEAIVLAVMLASILGITTDQALSFFQAIADIIGSIVK